MLITDQRLRAIAAAARDRTLRYIRNAHHPERHPCCLGSLNCSSNIDHRTHSQPAPTWTETAAGFRAALVAQVLNGDTIEVLVGGRVQRLRYMGIDSPEDGQPFSAEAEALNRELVESKQVFLDKDMSETDRYDRLL